MTAAPIRLEAVRFARPGFALAADLTLAERRIAIVGPSGSGKTTLLDLIAGLLVPQHGRVLHGARDVSALPEAQRRADRLAGIGFVFQSFELIDHLTVRENILYPRRIGPGLAPGDRARAEALAEAAGIAHRLGHKPAALSQGERQRTGVARALIGRPALVLADEPTGNLDPKTAARVLDLLIDQCAEAEAALIVVTHDHSLLPRFERVVDTADLTQ